jgi:type I restriction enzyme M protein
MVLSKHKIDNTTQFIDASGEDFYKKETNNNILTEDHIEKIIKLFADKQDIEHIAKQVSFDDIVKQDYNLSVSSYVETKDTREVINITKLNAEIKETVAKIDKLRADIDAIVEVIES